MNLEIISKLTPDEQKLCLFVMGWLGSTIAAELVQVLSGNVDRFTKTRKKDLKVIRQIARKRHIEKLG